MPLFFLIPIALFMVEPPDRLKRFYVVLIVLSICIVLSYFVSVLVGIPAETKVEHLDLWTVGSLQLTYFCENSHPGYDKSILAVSLLTMVMPILQKLTLKFVKVMVR